MALIVPWNSDIIYIKLNETPSIQKKCELMVFCYRDKLWGEFHIVFAQKFIHLNSRVVVIIDTYNKSGVKINLGI